MYRLKEKISFFLALLIIIYKVRAQVGTPCTEGERMINEVDCTTYFYCSVQVDGSTLWVDTPCRDGTIFLPGGDDCVEGIAEDCNNREDTFECEGKASKLDEAHRGFADPHDNTKYWWCELLPNGEWNAVKYMCPLDHTYSKEYKHCISDKTITTTTTTTTPMPPSTPSRGPPVGPDIPKHKATCIREFSKFV